jgi:hypothetical protein
MFTSNFTQVKKIVAAGLEPVAISRGVPGWYTGRRDLRLAPARAMLRAPAAEFDSYFNDLLLQLDPLEIYDALGHGSVLLCWEKPGEGCHRRDVAQWLEAHLPVVIPEFGRSRRMTGWQAIRAYHFYLTPEERERAMDEMDPPAAEPAGPDVPAEPRQLEMW